MPRLFSGLIHLDLMEEVEAARMGIWFLMMQHKQRAVARGILGGGMRLLELLRAASVHLTQLEAEDWKDWRAEVAAWAHASFMAEEYMKQAKCDERWINRLARLRQTLWAFGSVRSAGVTGTLADIGKHGPEQTSEVTQCDVVPSTPVVAPSPPTCSPAVPTGFPSLPGCGTASGTPTTPTVAEALGLTPSATNKGQSSKRRGRRGKGPAKRASGEKPGERKKGR